MSSWGSWWNLLDSKGLDKSTHPPWSPPPPTHRVSSYLYSLPAALLGRHPVVMTSQNSWSLHCKPEAIFTVLHCGLPRPPLWDSVITKDVVASVTLWNRASGLHDHLSVASFMYPKPGPSEECFKVLLPAQDAAWLPWTRAVPPSVFDPEEALS